MFIQIKIGGPGKVHTVSIKGDDARGYDVTIDGELHSHSTDLGIARESLQEYVRSITIQSIDSQLTEHVSADKNRETLGAFFGKL